MSATPLHLPVNFPGTEVARVEARCDPQRMGRVKVRVVGIHSETIPVKKLPWAYPDAPGGLFFVPPLGSWVRVTFQRGDPNYPSYHGGWWGVGEASRATGASAHYKLKDNSFRLPTSWFGSDKVRSKESILKNEDGADPINSPDNFNLTSPLQKRVELDDRLSRERIVLADFFGNGLVINTENSAITLESFKGLRAKDPAPASLTLNPAAGGIQTVTPGGWTVTSSDSENTFEVASPGGVLVRIDQKRGRFEAWTQRGSRIVLDDPTQRIEAVSPLGRKLILDDLNELSVLHGINAGQYFLIDDRNERVEVYAKNIAVKSQHNINISAGEDITIDGKRIFLNSDYLDLEKSFRGVPNLLKPSRLALLKKSYDYPYFKDPEKAKDS